MILAQPDCYQHTTSHYTSKFTHCVCRRRVMCVGQVHMHAPRPTQSLLTGRLLTVGITQCPEMKALLQAPVSWQLPCWVYPHRGKGTEPAVSRGHWHVAQRARRPKYPGVPMATGHGGEWVQQCSIWVCSCIWGTCSTSKVYEKHCIDTFALQGPCGACHSAAQCSA